MHQSQNGDAQDDLVLGKALPAYAKKALRKEKPEGRRKQIAFGVVSQLG